MDYEMDLSKVYVVRSAKGVDMLCVDDYLYHFDRIGKNGTYRWLCNRRKDKTIPCKSRISTMLSNSLDKCTHMVVDVAMAHTHPRCSNHEITKVMQRKRLSSARNDQFHVSQPKRAREYERATAALSPPEWISTMTIAENASIILDFEDKDHVYMLRRRDGRIMVCVDGHLYYLEGRSAKEEVFRWSCVRKRDIDCTADICTEATLAGSHRLRVMESDAHIHPHYSAGKLMHMFTKHQIALIEDEQVSDILEDCPFVEDFDTMEQITSDDLESMIIEDCEENYDTFVENVVDNINETVLNNQYDDNTAAAAAADTTNTVKWPSGSDIIEQYEPQPGHDPLTETDLTKFIFLPSAKGKKVLCLNRYLYHFDSQSRSNGHMFFTCILRRDKQNSCHVRVTLNITDHGPTVLRINGEHTHEPDLDEIVRRINRQKKLQSAQALAKTQSFDEEYHPSDEDAAFEIATTLDTSYDQLNQHLQNTDNLPSKIDEMRHNVIMKKVIGIDGIKMEPDICTKPNMIVQYMKDAADNISAKIEILPSGGVCGDPEIPEMAKSTTYQPPPPQITNSRRPKMVGSAIAEQSCGDDILESSIQQVQSPDMDLTNISLLRSAKGSEMLCVDGYIYHAKNRGLISRNYWVCIKSRDPETQCKSRISTATQKDGSIRVLRVYNSHCHPVNEDDIKRRLFNEINKKSNKKLKFRPLHFMEKSLEQIKAEYGDLAIERLNVSNLSDDIVVHKKQRNANNSNINSNNSAISPPRATRNAVMQSPLSMQVPPDHEIEEDFMIEEEAILPHDQFANAIENVDVPNIIDSTSTIIEMVEEATDLDNYDVMMPVYTMKLYAVSDGPPSLAVRMTLKALGIQYQLINVDFCALEHRSDEYAKMNPQKEIPVLDDDGFYLSESIAIMQYLCDKYAPESLLYPQDAQQRALVNQRLCFNMSFYYGPISAHAMAPIFFDYERTPMSLKKVQNALEVFETYLQRLGTKYATGNDVTIADFALVAATLCLEAIEFDLSPYPLVQKWYLTFKEEYPDLWEIANGGMQEINEFEHNPPDLSHVEHPFHPTRKLHSV